MSTKMILEQLNKHNPIKFRLDEIEEMPEFLTGFDTCSFESLLLKVNGHQGIKNYKFDSQKFEKWCEENNIRQYTDQLNRIVHLKLQS